MIDAREQVLSICKQYLKKPKRSGNDNIMALCPFHDNVNTPAFAMSVSTGLWFCFGCHARGNLFSFLKLMGLGQARIKRDYQILLDDLGKAMGPRFDPSRPGVREVEPLDESLLGVFNQCPLGMIEEGFSEEILQQFEVGFDDLHQRITFPLRDLEGRLVGISGRATFPTSMRYKVYDKEYEDFELPARQTNKSIVLWNAHNVFPAIHHQRRAFVVVVEGFKACMRVAEGGITNVVALLGSTMTDHQKWILSHLGAEIYLMLDNNKAGQDGTKYIGSTLGPSLGVRIVKYDQEQPSDIPASDIPSVVSNNVDYYAWRVHNVLR